MERDVIANYIVEALSDNKAQLKRQYLDNENAIAYFIVDDLLPQELAKRIYKMFPEPQTMMMRKSLREYKYVAAQMDEYEPILAEAIYAFQNERVLSLVQDICGIEKLLPDEKLYAGGISLMGEGHFLNPHLDNSHEIERKHWRVLNLLYYTSPNWQKENGGNLELWPNGLGGKAITIESKFNRLVVMATHGESWHSVSPITVNKTRTCVSNYYFSADSLRQEDGFHVTSFRGRPDQKIRDFLLRGDRQLRQIVRKFFPRGLVKTKHVYEKDNNKK